MGAATSTEEPIVSGEPPKSPPPSPPAEKVETDDDFCFVPCCGHRYVPCPNPRVHTASGLHTGSLMPLCCNLDTA